jgi:hypothetical protein
LGFFAKKSQKTNPALYASPAHGFFVIYSVKIHTFTIFLHVHHRLAQTEKEKP